MTPVSSQSALFRKAAAQPQFRRVCDGANAGNRQLPFDIVFADKKTNLAGLQLADGVARPVGLSYIRPQQANQAFDILKKKFFCDGGRTKVGSGDENVALRTFAGKLRIYGEPLRILAGKLRTFRRGRKCAFADLSMIFHVRGITGK